MFSANNLSTSSSLYLQQHKNQPIHWQEWSDSTLKYAQQQNKPLIISIGYSTCHWCHVMAQEAFSNSNIADYMNKHFVCIKVDRETHPDVDQIYLEAVQAFTGQGGWPLNCFALPNGKPFHGGLYFKEADWMNLLKQIQHLYTNEFQTVVEYATQLQTTLEQKQSNHSLIPPSIQIEDFKELADDFFEEFDNEHKGFEGSPKFPLPHTWLSMLLLVRATHQKDHQQKIEELAKVFLTKGITDLVEGGWFRYSVHNDWNWPHFEKMLYDQALILSFLSEIEDIPENLISFHAQAIIHKFKNEGLFSAGIDADSEGEEGKYYVIQPEEIIQLPQPEILNLSDIEQEQHVYLQRIDDWKVFIQEVQPELLKIRSFKIKPTIDKKQIVSWNAMFITGLIKTCIRFPNKIAILDPLRYLETLINHSTNELHEVKRTLSSNHYHGFLDDYVFLAEACFLAYKSSFKEVYIHHAIKLLEQIETLFYSAKNPLYNLSSYQHAHTFITPQEKIDNVIPASNSILSSLFFEIGSVTMNNEWIAKSRKMNEYMQTDAFNAPSRYTNWTWNNWQHFAGLKEVYIVGQQAKSWAKAISTQHHLNYNVYLTEDGNSTLQSLKQKAQHVSDETVAYICKNYSCSSPIISSKELCHLLSSH